MPGFLAGPIEPVHMCLLALGHCGCRNAWISLLAMLVSPFWKGSLQGSLQSLCGERTKWLQSCSGVQAVLGVT